VAPRSVAADRPGEPELLALVSEPYGDADEVRRGLDVLPAAFESREDRRDHRRVPRQRLADGRRAGSG